MLFNNCNPVLVEGPSDQIYLSAIKTLLISFGELTPKKDIIFIPSGGTRGVKPIVSLLTGKNDELPTVLLDGDTQGSKMAEALRKDLYQDTPNSILIVSEIIGMDQAEIEDLIPPSIMKKLSRYQLRSNDPDSDFEDYYAKDLPILKQLEEFAVTNEIMLEKGWKVEFAKLVKNHLLKISRDKISEDTINIWKTLFSKLN
ncbi:hypothetical protein [Acinetobacter haemolyticus]|nr:hypothetical protein [Acinetobacter haemolyticus]